MAGIYWEDIKGILSLGVGCMSERTVSTDKGVFEVKLDDYESVKRLHAVIMAALNAWERDGNDWKEEVVEDGKKKYFPTKVHHMPPSVPLPIADVDKFITWVADGTPENPPAIA